MRHVSNAAYGNKRIAGGRLKRNRNRKRAYAIVAAKVKSSEEERCVSP